MRIALIRAAIGLALGIGGSLAGCSAGPERAPTAPPSPTTVAPASPIATGSPSTPPASPPLSPTASPTATGVTMFTISSSAFAEGGSIPARYTCSGPDVSPPLAWTGVPAGTRAFVLLVDDPDASGWVHWLVVDLPASTTSLAEDASKTLTAVQGQTSWGTAGWRGPCPPSGTHRYVFTLSALDAPTGLTGAPTAAQVRAALSGHVLSQATLTARYSR